MGFYLVLVALAVLSPSAISWDSVLEQCLTGAGVVCQDSWQQPGTLSQLNPSSSYQVFPCS